MEEQCCLSVAGALITKAVTYCRSANLRVDLVCCPPKDLAASYLRRTGIAVLETHDPNVDLLPRLDECRDGVAFSINNRHLLNDRLVDAGVRFFNIHNGLVQGYRGIGIVCMFAALCNGEQRYGATLHQILPGQKADTGPVVAQLDFAIPDGAGFSDLMAKSLDACHTIFEQNVARVASGAWSAISVPRSEHAYTYKDVSRLCAQTDVARLAKATSFGTYAPMLGKLTSAIEAHRAQHDKAASHQT